MSADVIDFEERTGSIKNLAATRRLANEFVGPVSNKIGNPCVDDPENCSCETIVYRPSDFVADEKDPA